MPEPDFLDPAYPPGVPEIEPYDRVFGKLGQVRIPVKPGLTLGSSSASRIAILVGVLGVGVLWFSTSKN